MYQKLTLALLIICCFQVSLANELKESNNRPLDSNDVSNEPKAFRDLKEQEADANDAADNKDLTKLEFMKSPLNRTINDFGLKFLQQLIKNDENQCNIFYSPFSVSLMFTMLLHGTDGRTKQQILNTFGYLTNLNLDTKEIHQSFQDVGIHI